MKGVFGERWSYHFSHQEESASPKVWVRHYTLLHILSSDRPADDRDWYLSPATKNWPPSSNVDVAI
jgi:hypothetical protein